ncbi:hypothetical protein DPMN_066974 [Dreissena polymorpha]|uniref:Uncharacterized protein n=1 Tax=Dreissena polymorpha TaxID=45954 RepID=A0A9D3YZY5_DREPO|nr:hypothetical protein DPMN_066974 [Dreissena polymorpha]
MRHPVTTSNNSQQITQDRTLNVVIRNLPETASGSTSSKVNAMLKDGLKLSNITVSRAERKKSRTESRPGVVIATFKCKEDKQTVMNAKPDLRHISQYSKVFINQDLAPEQRKNSQNFATILRAAKSDNLTMRGTRIVNRRSGDNREESRRLTIVTRGETLIVIVRTPMIVVSTICVITVTDVIRGMTLATGTTTGSFMGIVMVQWVLECERLENRLFF